MMKYIFYKLLSIILPTKTSRKNYKNICNLIKKYKENNRLIIVDENGVEHLNPLKVKGLNVVFKGNNNIITIHKPFYAKGLDINIDSNVHIVIGKNAHFRKGCEILKSNGKYLSSLIFGDNFSCAGRSVFDISSRGDIIIGNNNMFSWGIYLKTDDSHSIFDKNTKKLLNESTQIETGDNVWVCMKATILKNSKIPSHSIVGAHSVVAKSYQEENIIIAGNPSKICKKDIDWSILSINDYLDKEI